MKKTRRFAAIAAAVAMTACMAMPMAMTSFAYDITINKEGTTTADTAHTYSAYQIFSGTINDDGVLGNIVWGEGVNGDAIVTALKADATVKSLFTADSYTAAQVAEVISSMTKNSTELDAVAKIFSANKGSATAYTSTDGVITTAKPGYYLIEDTTTVASGDAKSKFILEVVKDVTTTAKRDYPDMEKKVKENTKYDGFYTHENGTTDYTTAATYNDVADYCMGDTVTFQLIGTLPSDVMIYDGYYYKFTDTLATGLTLDADSIKVYIVNDGALSDETALTEGYAFAANGQEFTITFDDIQQVDGVSGDSVVIVEYDAVLNQDAQVGLNGNENVAKLTYSNNPNWVGSGDTDVNDDETSETPEEKVIVFTYELDVTKYLGEYVENGTNTTADDQPLTQAGFKLYSSDGKKVATLNTDNEITGWTDAAVEGAGTEVKTDANGQFSFIGLDDGTYVLKETTTPNGYNTMDDLTLTITAGTVHVQNYNEAVEYDTAAEVLTDLDLTTVEGTSTVYLDGEKDVAGDNTDGKVATYVENLKGSTLPSTGGIGTTLFYVVGGTLVAGTGVTLIAKKRMKKED